MSRELRGQDTVPSATIPPRTDKAPAPPPVASGAMPDLPEIVARIAAEEAFAKAHRNGATLTACLQVALEAAAPALYAQGAERERAKLAAVIPGHRFRLLADWFDEDDKVKMMLCAEDPTLPSTWEKRGDGLQSDLRRFADLLDGDDG